MLAPNLLESILMGAPRAHPHGLGVAPPSPAGRRRNADLPQIGTAIKPGRRRLTTVNNTIARKLERVALADFECL